MLLWLPCLVLCSEDCPVITNRINNFTANTMYYSLFFHPAFNIEGDVADYRLDFAPEQEKLTDLLIDPAPFRSEKEAAVELKDSSLPLSYPMLDKGLKIYNADDISTVKLTSSHTHSITMDLHDFPFLAVWSPEKKQASFVCVEAFRGLSDQYGKVGELKERGTSCFPRVVQFAGNVDYF